ncbi:SNF2-related domain-containing protein [Heterostelium album PN500]|uniref:SNF2-related domain-containing protein n=1 Tax=Heterostelium pallidum (strain ATCC 26659 / Pp 5 / PN500) TaxID=670386 RepID=D3B6J3_HETP5|nr:SNF2-related domain-containing protein [Heterostelium album PN500]EFA82963.1 SNF2-related domain-containing protein [Heterostelium album PN500]|eukprot:XP_020435080.1 SNF2-related domain-containing protein [Heterostelium album PN500]
MPHIFGKIKNNSMLEELLSHAEGNNAIISRMKKILSPFFLRRLKSEVSLELKPKEETINRCKLTDVQSKFYADLVARSKKQLEARLEAKQDAKDAKEKAKQAKLKAKELSRKRKSSKTIDVDDEEVEEDDEEEMLDLDQIDLVDEEKKGKKKKEKALTTNQMMTNLLMELRKISNHPLLCKNFYYKDEQIREIKQILRMNDNEFIGYTMEEMDEIFLDYSDYEIHCIAQNQTRNLLEKYIIPDTFIVECSTKCLKLNELLDAERKKGNKVLVFSMMTRVLDILEEVLSMQDISFCRLDGTTPVNDRQDIIDLFSGDKTIPVMLLSTLAGGLGINLTCANVVIFYDISFNPQVERQAEDRAHRLGQEKTVYIHRIIVDDSVDNNILEMSTTKRELNDSMLEEGSYAAANDNNSKLESKKIVKLLTSILA